MADRSLTDLKLNVVLRISKASLFEKINNYYLNEFKRITKDFSSDK